MHPARVAILEGGGMRGCITAYFLMELEQRAGCLLCELFDLVVGTSTGGILAALIASGVPATQMAEFYETDGPKIFKRSLGRAVKTLFSSAESKYDNRPLIQCLEVRLPTSKTCKHARTNFMVPTWDGNDDENLFIKSYKGFWKDFPLAWAAIATASAPTYFPGFVPKNENGQPAKYGGCDSRFFDGGFIENNPTTCTLHEIKELFPQRPVIVVNFGTGYLANKATPAPDGGWVPWAMEVYPRMATLQNRLSERTSKHMFEGKSYYRIDAVLEEPIELDDAREATLAKMKALAQAAVAKNESHFAELARLLKV